MRGSQPTADVLHTIFEADFELGVLMWRARPVGSFRSEKCAAAWNLRFAGRAAGGPHKAGYQAVWVTIGGRRISLLVHRVLWCMRHGEWPTATLDHADCNRLNNSIANLREATFSQQNANRPAIRRGLKGACFDKGTGRFIAQITHQGRNRFLGRFHTEEQAHDAYVRAAAAIHGEFARG